MRTSEMLVVGALIGSMMLVLGTPLANAADPVTSAQCLENATMVPDVPVGPSATMTGGDAAVSILPAGLVTGFAPRCVTILDASTTELTNGDALAHNPSNGIPNNAATKPGKCFLYNVQHGGGNMASQATTRMVFRYDADAGIVSSNVDGQGFKDCPSGSAVLEADRATIPYFCTIHTGMQGTIVVLAN